MKAAEKAAVGDVADEAANAAVLGERLRRAEERNNQLEGEIAERQRVEAALRKREAEMKAALREKEVLLRELHHRIKNSLHVVIGLLRLQESQSTEPQVVAALTESRNRVRAIAKIHETVSESDNLSAVDLRRYVRNLITSLVRSFGDQCLAVQLTSEVGEKLLAIDRAVPIGLIINELVANALQHAFPAPRQGEVRVALRPVSADELALVVADNGVGLPAGLDLQTTATVGLPLVKALAEHQLGGTLEIERAGGTRVTVRFARA